MAESVRSNRFDFDDFFDVDAEIIDDHKSCQNMAVYQDYVFLFSVILRRTRKTCIRDQKTPSGFAFDSVAESLHTPACDNASGFKFSCLYVYGSEAGSVLYDYALNG